MEARSLGKRGACYKTSDWARFEDGGCRHTGSVEKEAHIVSSRNQNYLSRGGWLGFRKLNFALHGGGGERERGKVIYNGL